MSYLRSLKSPSKQTVQLPWFRDTTALLPDLQVGILRLLQRLDLWCMPHVMFAMSSHGRLNWNSEADLSEAMCENSKNNHNFGWTSEKVSMNWPDDIPLRFQMKMFPLNKKNLNTSSQLQPVSAGCISWASKQPPVPAFHGSPHQEICDLLLGPCRNKLQTKWKQQHSVIKHNRSYGF